MCTNGEWSLLPVSYFSRDAIVVWQVPLNSVSIFRLIHTLVGVCRKNPGLFLDVSLKNAVVSAMRVEATLAARMPRIYSVLCRDAASTLRFTMFIVECFRTFCKVRAWLPVQHECLFVCVRVPHTVLLAQHTQGGTDQMSVQRILTFYIADACACGRYDSPCYTPVSYTHLTLPTNREV